MPVIFEGYYNAAVSSWGEKDCVFIIVFHSIPRGAEYGTNNYKLKGKKIDIKKKIKKNDDVV